MDIGHALRAQIFCPSTDTGDIHVRGKIIYTTIIAKSAVAAGRKEELKEKELKRVNLAREGVFTAQLKADALARAVFKGNEAEAKKAVEESTRAVMNDQAWKGRMRWDVGGDPILDLPAPKASSTN